MKFLIVLAIAAAVAWHFYKPLPPGQGPEAAKWKRVAGSVASAIEAYKSARGMYPGSLDDMVPEFMGAPPPMAHGGSLEYQRLGQNFKLTFSYADPLPVHCSMEAGRKWECEWF